MLPATVRPTEAAAVHPSPRAPARHPKGHRGTDRASRYPLGSMVVANRGCRVRGSHGCRARGSRRDRLGRGSRRDRQGRRVRGSRRADHRDRLDRRVRGSHRPDHRDRRDLLDRRVRAEAEVRPDHHHQGRRVRAAAEVRPDHHHHHRGRHIARPAGTVVPHWRRLTPD
jgi:hypothetical protein